MNQNNINIEIYSSLSNGDQDNVIYHWASLTPENFKTYKNILLRLSKTEEEIQEIISSKQPPLTLSDLKTDSENNQPADVPVDEPVLPPATVTLRRLTDLDLQRLNQLNSADRRREISKLNLNDRDHDHLINKLWRLRNPDRVRSNSRRAYQKKRGAILNNIMMTIDDMLL
jgi:hypothetical protein